MAIALVKSAKGTSALAITAPAFGSATTSGNLVVLAFTSDAYNGTPDAGWTQSAGMSQQANHGGYVWWRISTGETAYQYTIGGAFNSAWVLQEFSGTSATPYDISSGQFINTSLGSFTTPTITPTAGNRLLLASIGGTSGTEDLSGAYSAWLNSFTAIASGGQSTGSRQCTGTAYRLVTADGSTGYSSGATYPLPSSPNTRSGLIIAFKEAAAAIGSAAALGGSGSAYFDDAIDSYASRKRRRKFLQDRDRRIRDL